MKQMTYCKNNITEVLHQGEYRNHKFAIINLGSYPVAYVSTELNIKDLTDRLLENIKAHNGFFSYGKAYRDDSEEQYLGWDYNGITDYYGGLEGTTSISARALHKWTTEEIFEDVKEVITQLDKVERKNAPISNKGISLTFAEMCEYLTISTKGCWMRRKSWNEHECIYDNGVYIMMRDDRCDMDEDDVYTIIADDIIATDWEFYKKGDDIDD